MGGWHYLSVQVVCVCVIAMHIMGDLVTTSHFNPPTLPHHNPHSIK